MAKNVICAGGVYASTSSSTPRHVPFGNSRCSASFFNAASSETTWPVASTLSQFSTQVFANTRSGVASTVAGIYINGVASALSVTIPIGTTGRFTDITNTASVAADDEVCVGVLPQNGGGGSCQFGNFICLNEPATGATLRHISFFAGAAVGNATTYSAFVGATPSSTESIVRLDSAAGTLSYLQVRCDSNARDGDVVITSRINGVDGNLTVTIPASTTGTFIDTTHSDTVAVDDDITWKIVRGGTTGSVTLQYIAGSLDYTGDKFMSYLAGDATYAPGSATDYFCHIGGQAQNTADYTDAATKQLWPMSDVEASQLDVKIPINSIAASSTYTLRVNGADTALSVTIPASTTGTFSNTTDSVALTAGDEVNYKLGCGTSGSITFRQAGMTFTPTAAPSSYLPRAMLLGVG